MATTPEENLKKDIFKSAFLSLPLLGFLAIFNDPLVVLENINTFNSTITTLLGLLFTILAIIYTFESQFEENRAVKQLKRIGKYRDVTNIFFLSVAALGIVWIYTFSLSVFQFHESFNSYIQIGFAYLGTMGFLLVVLRLWRCFSIFVLLNKAIKSNEEEIPNRIS